MAINMEILTENAAGDGCFDAVPEGIATGYQAQNTNFGSRNLGVDKSSVSITATDVVVHASSGAIDVNGLPFVIKEDVIFSLSGLDDGVSYLYVDDVVGDILQKELKLTQGNITWNSSKYYYETSGGFRVLNWKIEKYRQEDDTEGISLFRLQDVGEYLEPKLRVAEVNIELLFEGGLYIGTGLPVPPFTKTGKLKIMEGNDSYSLLINSIVKEGTDNYKRINIKILSREEITWYNPLRRSAVSVNMQDIHISKTGYCYAYEEREFDDGNIGIIFRLNDSSGNGVSSTHAIDDMFFTIPKYID